MSELGGRPGIEPWQIQQTSGAVRVYRHQYRTPADRREAEGNVEERRDGRAVLNRLGEVIRRRHYVRRTEETYLHRVRRLLAYRPTCGGPSDLTGDEALHERQPFPTVGTPDSAASVCGRDLVQTTVCGDLKAASASRTERAPEAGPTSDGPSCP